MHSALQGFFFSLVSVFIAVFPAYANEKAEPDPAQSTYWEPIRNIMFGDREILDGKDVLRVYLPLRADDASTVPVTVKAQVDQRPDYSTVRLTEGLNG